MRLETSFAAPSRRAAVRATVPLGRTMSAPDFVVIVCVYEPPVNALVALQIILSRSKAGCLVQSNTSV